MNGISLTLALLLMAAPGIANQAETAPAIVKQLRNWKTSGSTPRMLPRSIASWRRTLFTWFPRITF